MSMGVASSVVNMLSTGRAAMCVLATNVYEGAESLMRGVACILKTITSPFLVPMNRNELERCSVVICERC